MKKKKIGIIFGGCSSEYEVSLQSVSQVIKNIDKNKYESVLIGITKKGSWFRYYGDVKNIEDDTWHECKAKCVPVVISPNREVHGIVEFSYTTNQTTQLDAIFPVLHGKNGEDGTVQGAIELAGIPLVGCNTLSSALCMDKNRAHRLVKAEGIAVPESVTFTRKMIHDDAKNHIKALTYPLYVKPVKAGSSFGITRVENESMIDEAVDNAFRYDSEVIVEEEIKGFEVGCAVLGNEYPLVGEVDEIELVDGFFDYKEKYTLETSRIHMPARVDKQTAIQIKNTAVEIYRILGCSGFARVDLFLKPDGDIVFNEVNTIPGFTSHSRYPNMMKGINVTYAEIIDRLIELSLE